MRTSDTRLYPLMRLMSAFRQYELLAVHAKKEDVVRAVVVQRQPTDLGQVDGDIEVVIEEVSILFRIE